jgi:hypothetical protein
MSVVRDKEGRRNRGENKRRQMNDGESHDIKRSRTDSSKLLHVNSKMTEFLQFKAEVRRLAAKEKCIELLDPAYKYVVGLKEFLAHNGCGAESKQFWLEQCRKPTSDGVSNDPSNFDTSKVEEYKIKIAEEALKRQQRTDELRGRFHKESKERRTLLASEITCQLTGKLQESVVKWLQKNEAQVNNPEVDGVILTLVSHINDLIGAVSVELYNETRSKLANLHFEGGNPMVGWNTVDNLIEAVNEMASTEGEKITGPTAMILEFMRYFASFKHYIREIAEMRQRLRDINTKIILAGIPGVTSYDDWVQSTQSTIVLPVAAPAVSHDPLNTSVRVVRHAIAASSSASSSPSTIAVASAAGSIPRLGMIRDLEGLSASDRREMQILDATKKTEVMRITTLLLSTLAEIRAGPGNAQFKLTRHNEATDEYNLSVTAIDENDAVSRNAIMAASKEATEGEQALQRQEAAYAQMVSRMLIEYPSLREQAVVPNGLDVSLKREINDLAAKLTITYNLSILQALTLRLKLTRGETNEGAYVGKSPTKACYGCGSTSHLRSACPVVATEKTTEKICQRCLRSGHITSACWAIKTKDGISLLPPADK